MKGDSADCRDPSEKRKSVGTAGTVARRLCGAAGGAVLIGFEEFPADPDLVRFDRDDQKFAAVAIASGEPAPILNASDTDWWNYREALGRYGVEVRFLCRELMTGKAEMARTG